MPEYQQLVENVGVAAVQLRQAALEVSAANSILRGLGEDTDWRSRAASRFHERVSELGVGAWQLEERCMTAARELTAQASAWRS